MFFNPAMMSPGGPPPQEVLDKRPSWIFLAVLIVGIAIFRFVTVDLVGGILGVLMFSMTWMMISDGMVEMQRYAFVFGALCMLCVLFDLVPLLTSLDGRSEVTYQPVSRSHTSSGFSVMYSAIVKTTPLFDPSQGFVYNATSAVMILSPLTMMLGAYLAFHAHVEIQRATGDAWGDDGMQSWWMGNFSAEGGAAGDRAGGGGGHGQRHLRAVGRFQGAGRRLDPAAPVLTPPEEEGGAKIPGLYSAKGSGPASSADLAQDILRPGLTWVERQTSEDDAQATGRADR